MPKTPDAGWKGAYSPETEYVPKGFDPTYEGDPEPEDDPGMVSENALEEEEEPEIKNEPRNEVEMRDCEKERERECERDRDSDYPNYSPSPLDYFPESRQDRLSACKDADLSCLVRAMKKPHHPATSKFTPKKRLLVSLCREMQALHEDKTFYLSERQAARLLDCSNRAAWRMIKELKAGRIIREVSKGCIPGKMASEYFYLLDDL